MSDNKTFHDKVSDGVLDFLNKAKTELNTQLPKPPGVRPMTEVEQLQVYNTMNPQQRVAFVQQHGVTNAESYFGKMEMLKLRRQGNG